MRGWEGSFSPFFRVGERERKGVYDIYILYVGIVLNKYRG